MSRNDQSFFATLPSVNIGRSRMHQPFSHKTTFNAGSLVPFYVREVLPGDSVSMDTTVLTRMTTPIFPVMDTCYQDTFYFFCPSRILWNHWKELNGENNNTPWTEGVEYLVPQCTSPQGGWDKGSVADYMGIPTGVDGFEISALPFRAYVLIWNEFFRDTAYMRPAAYSLGDSTQQGYKTTYTPNTQVEQFEDPRFYSLYSAIGGGKLLPVSKAHDYFTSVLPESQFGEPVQIPVFSDDMLPVGTSSATHGASDARLHLSDLGTTAYANLASQSGYVTAYTGVSASGTANSTKGYPDNLWLNMADVNVGTISDLRRAFAVQKLLETDGRYGTRYTSVLYGHFGVSSPDSRLQRPEYLGGSRNYLNIDQVLQTSATNEVSPQGNTAAFSLTVKTDNSFTKSFVEHGFIIGLTCVRTDHTYQQGLEKFWSRKRRYDFYWPELANISAQPVLRKEIFLSGDEELDNAVFGYQEAWADYRYHPNRVSGAFRSNYQGTLDSWHYADYFEGSDSAPFIASGAFIAETPVNIDRTLAVSSDVEDQFLCDIYCDSVWTRPMPLYSVPGLTGHM